MRGDAEAAETVNVLGNRLAGTAQGIRRTRHVERHIVPIVGADLHGVEHQHAIDVLGRIGRTRGVAVIGEDDELQSGARRGRGHGCLVAMAVRSRSVHVIRPAHGAGGQALPSGSVDVHRARRREQKQKDAGRDDGRDQRPGQSSKHAGPEGPAYLPASARRAFALSVRSQVNSGSVRPKWPKAAVFL